MKIYRLSCSLPDEEEERKTHHHIEWSEEEVHESVGCVKETDIVNLKPSSDVLEVDVWHFEVEHYANDRWN